MSLPDENGDSKKAKTDFAFNNMSESHPLLRPSIADATSLDNIGSTSTIRHSPKLPVIQSALKTFSHPEREQHNDHRRRTSLSDLFVATGAGIRTVAGDVRDTASELTNAFHDDVQESRTGRKFFLDFTITRNLSVLPENITELLEIAVDDFRSSSHLQRRSKTYHPLSDSVLDDSGRIDEKPSTDTDDEEEALTKSDRPTTKKEDDFRSAVTACLGLLVAVLSVSSNGTALSFLRGVNPCIKLYWRMIATAALLSFFAIRATIRMFNKVHEEQKIVGLYNISKHIYDQVELKTILEFIGATVCFTVHVMFYFYAFQYTTIGNVVIFANSQALIFIIGKAFVGQKVLCIEALGVIVAFSGAILCSADSDKDSLVTPPKSSKHLSAAKQNADDEIFFENIKGDLLALGAAVTGVMYLTFAKAVRPHMDVTIFMFLVMFLGSFIVLLYIMVTGIDYELSFDIKIGLFGWLTLQENHIYILLYIALICNVLGIMGFVRAMKYFDNLIIAVATLLEPMIASLIAYAFHAGPMPGLLGWVGNVLVACGTIAVIYPSISNPTSH